MIVSTCLLLSVHHTFECLVSKTDYKSSKATLAQSTSPILAQHRQRQIQRKHLVPTRAHLGKI